MLVLLIIVEDGKYKWSYYLITRAKSLQSCPSLCDPVDCSLLGSYIHGILQAKTLEWVCHAVLQGIFQMQESNPHLFSFLHWQVGSLPLIPRGKTHLVTYAKVYVCVHRWLWGMRLGKQQRGVIDHYAMVWASINWPV